MVRQSRESIVPYQDRGRLELANQGYEEIEIIKGFLPQKMRQKEIKVAVNRALTEISATVLKDMGCVMGLLKERYRCRTDFAKAAGQVKKID